MLEKFPSPEDVLRDWQAPLAHEQRQALAALYERETQARQALLPEDLARVDPVLTVLVESARQWLVALHAAWECNPVQAKKAVKAFDTYVDKSGLAFHELHEAIRAYCHEAVLQMLWEHERTKAQVRAGASNRKAFLQSQPLQAVNPFDVNAVMQTLAQAFANPETLTLQQQAIATALRSLGHFTSKPTHTSAQALGIVISPKAGGIGPYLTAGLVQQYGHVLWLDQTVNDNTGRTGFCLEALNSDAMQADTTAALVREVADGLFANGHEHGTHTIDPRLRQILLPVANGRYRAVTPLTSMGLSAYLHSHWQPWKPDADKTDAVLQQSFGQLMFYGFSTTAMNNFTAVRKVQHALEPDKTVGNIPNRALLFDVPRLDQAHATLARIQHRGYRLYLPKSMGSELLARYLEHRSILNQNSMSAMETERGIYRPVLRFIWQDLLAQQAQCADALDDLDDATRTAIFSEASGWTGAQKFLLLGMKEGADQTVSARALAQHLSSLLYAQVEQLKDERDKTLGLSATDRQRFMRWAPDAMARMFSQH